MISQTRLLRESSNKIPKLNPLDLYSIYDDFSNGDLLTGSVDGSLDIKGNTRTVRDVDSAISIEDSILNLLTTNTAARRCNIKINKDLSSSSNVMINCVFKRTASSHFVFGFTDEEDPLEYYLPSDGLIIAIDDALYKRAARSDTALGTDFSNDDEKVSWVFHFNTTTLSWYEKTTGIYSLIDSFAVSPSSPFYISLAVHSASPNAIEVYSLSAVETAYQSIGQLETLFPLV